MESANDIPEIAWHAFMHIDALMTNRNFHKQLMRDYRLDMLTQDMFRSLTR